MEWQWSLLLILGGLILLMATGMPVAFCFMLVNVIGVWFYWGGISGLEQLILSIDDSITIFNLLPLPLFILMGDVTFHSGVAPYMIDTLDKWLGRIPGRLGLLSVAAGTVFSTMTGTSTSSVAMLGSSLVPEMERRGYKKSMSLGPILGSGGLAIMIPPSGLAVILGALAQISIGKILIAIIVPGIVMAIIFAAYIVIRCKIQPEIAPPYNVPPTTISERVVATVKYILPVGIVIFMVIGVMMLGIATPTEAAATGALGSFIVAAIYKSVNWDMLKKSVSSTVKVTAMVFMILVGAAAFSQILAFSGASRGLAALVTGLQLPSIAIIVLMMIVLLFLGMFMSPGAIIMITVPMFVPVVRTLGLDLVWFAVLFLLNMEIGGISPPFGLSLFVMKGVATNDTTMGDVYRAAMPFFWLNLLVMALIIIFPGLALWLPNIMR